MSNYMPVRNLTQNGDTQGLIINIINSEEPTNDIVLCGLVKFKISNSITTSNNTIPCRRSQKIFMKMWKVFQSDPAIYSVKVLSDKLGIEGAVFQVVDNNIDEAHWQILHELDNAIIEFDMELSLNISSLIISGFTSLHEDTELTDFELRGADGSVKVHKAVLAGHSPVLKTMLTGLWKETTSGFVEVTNATQETLEQLKDFMYLHRLPESGIEKLAVIASLYMMSDLEECCAAKMLISATPNNAADLLDFSVKHNMEKLKLGILENIQGGFIKVEDMIKKCNTGRAELTDNQPIQ